MDKISKGIILRVRPLSDTSLIVHWITEVHGRLTTVAKGAKRPKSPHRGRLDLLFEADFTYRKNRRSDLHTLREVSLTSTHNKVNSDIKSLSILAYGTQLLEKATETDYTMPGIYIIFSTLLNYLDKHAPDPVLVFALEIKILNELGIAPPTTDVGLPDYTSNLIEQLGCLNWNDISKLKLNRKQVMSITGFLENHIAQNLHSIPKARASALSL